MTFTVVVPFVATDTARIAALGIVARHLRREHDWPVVVASPDISPWSKGHVVDEGVRASTTEGVIVHDADVLVAPDALRCAALAVTAGLPWAMPHSTVYRLSRRGMMRRIIEPVDVGAISDGDLERPPHPAPPGGGIVVCSRDAYEASGGIDPRFIGWGGEDISWARALDTLAGPGYHGDAPLWHLWHPPQTTRIRGGRGSAASEALASRYLDAAGDPTAMSVVVQR